MMYVKYAHRNSTTNAPHHLTTTCTVHAPNSNRLESIAQLLEFAARLSKISGKFKLRSCGHLCSGAMFRKILPNYLEKSKLWISKKKLQQVIQVNANLDSLQQHMPLLNEVPDNTQTLSKSAYNEKPCWQARWYSNLKNHSSILHNEDLPSQAPLHVGDPI